jgi:hypothetical protein
MNNYIIFKTILENIKTNYVKSNKPQVYLLGMFKAEKMFTAIYDKKENIFNIKIITLYSTLILFFLLSLFNLVVQKKKKRNISWFPAANHKFCLLFFLGEYSFIPTTGS